MPLSRHGSFYYCTLVYISKSTAISRATVHTSKSQSRIMQLKRQLQTARHGNLSITDYIEKMMSVSNILSLVGKPADEDDLVTLILNGRLTQFKLRRSHLPWLISMAYYLALRRAMMITMLLHTLMARLLHSIHPSTNLLRKRIHILYPTQEINHLTRANQKG